MEHLFIIWGDFSFVVGCACLKKYFIHFRVALLFMEIIFFILVKNYEIHYSFKIH